LLIDLSPDLTLDLTPDLIPDLTPDLIPDLTPDLILDLIRDLIPDLTPDLILDLILDLMPDPLHQTVSLSLPGYPTFFCSFFLSGNAIGLYLLVIKSLAIGFDFFLCFGIFI
jgi:hypothetical protein